VSVIIEFRCGGEIFLSFLVAIMVEHYTLLCCSGAKPSVSLVV